MQGIDNLFNVMIASTRLLMKKKMKKRNLKHFRVDCQRSEKKIQNIQEIKRTLFKWTKQDQLLVATWANPPTSLIFWHFHSLYSLHTHTHSLGQRSFFLLAVWNTLPYEIRSFSTLSSLNYVLKPIFFGSPALCVCVCGGGGGRSGEREN